MSEVGSQQAKNESGKAMRSEVRGLKSENLEISRSTDYAD